MSRVRGCAVAALALAVAGSVSAQDALGANEPNAPVEIVRLHVDIDVNPDGTYVEAEESALRILDSRAQRAFQQTTLTYSAGLQSLEVESAYTLKASGKKIYVPSSDFLHGSGASSAPGFEDVKTLTIVFPQLEVGDEIVITTLRKQLVPLFADEFAMRREFSRAIKADDVQLTLTSPKDALPLKIESVGVDGGQRAEYAGKFRWVWRYHNDAPTSYALDSVVASNNQPHVIASSFPGYATVGQAYASHFAGKADPNPEIRALANRLTAGIADRRAQAIALYDWVSKNISYVNIVLGAGGFTPHAASDVLTLRYGDCKDHVMLLEALLAARGIASEPALIDANGPYVLSTVPSSYYFNHLISYIPEFRLFLDSTARYAPFGTLPFDDADRPVVLVPTGEVSGTPNDTADKTMGRATVRVQFAPDGTAEGNSQFAMTGAAAIRDRALIDAVQPDREKELFQLALGPGSDVAIDRGNVQALSDPFTYSMRYSIPAAANFSGPGAISTALAIGPFMSGALSVGLLPAIRESDYVCPSFSTSQTSTFALPPNIVATSVPTPVSIAAEGIRFEMHFVIRDPHTVTGTTALRADHPRAFCTPEYYNKVRGDLARIAASLRGQILYK